MWLKFAMKRISALNDDINNLRVPEEIKDLLRNQQPQVAGKILQKIKLGLVPPTPEAIQMEIANLSQRTPRKQAPSVPRKVQIPRAWFSKDNQEFNLWLQNVVKPEFLEISAENIRALEDFFKYIRQTAPGFDFSQIGLKDALVQCDKWHADLKENVVNVSYEETKPENVFAQWPDDPDRKGWTIQLLDSQRDYNAEGRNMGHCAATYLGRSISGTSFNFSLRDPRNKPRITFEINQNGEIVQTQGPHNTSIPENSKEMQMINDFIKNIDKKELVDSIIQRWKAFSSFDRSSTSRDAEGKTLVLITDFKDLRAAVLNKLVEINVTNLYVMSDQTFFIGEVYYRVLGKSGKTVGVATNALSRDQDLAEQINRTRGFISDIVSRLNNCVDSESFRFEKMSSNSDYQLYSYYIMSITNIYPEIDNVVSSLSDNAVIAIVIDNINNPEPEWVRGQHDIRNKIDNHPVGKKFLEDRDRLLGSKEDGELQRVLSEAHPAIISTVDINIAIEKKNISLVKFLINNGADVNASSGGWTLLLWASHRGNLELAALLIEAGADVNAKDEYGNTPLLLVSDRGHLEIVKLLIEAGADVNVKNEHGDTPLHWASDRGHLEIVKLLIERGADVNAKNENGYTPLHLASDRGNLEIVKLLIKAGADVNVKNERGDTSLHWASEKGHLEIVKLLIEAGADVNVKNERGYTLLLLASYRGNLELAALLIKAGVDVDAKNEYGNTPLHWASRSGDLELAKLLIERGADVNAKDGYEYTPLHRASEKGHLEVVKLLIENGAIK